MTLCIKHQTLVENPEADKARHSQAVDLGMPFTSLVTERDDEMGRKALIHILQDVGNIYYKYI